MTGVTATMTMIPLMTVTAHAHGCDQSTVLAWRAVETASSRGPIAAERNLNLFERRV